MNTCTLPEEFPPTTMSKVGWHLTMELTEAAASPLTVVISSPLSEKASMRLDKKIGFNNK